MAVEKPPVPPKPANVQTGFQSSPPPKKEKPPVAPKPSLTERPKAPLAKEENGLGPVNSEVQDPPTSSLKDRIKLLNLQGDSPVFPH